MEEIADGEERRAAVVRLEQLTHALGCAFYAADSLLKQYVYVAKTFEDKDHPSTGVVFINSEYRDPMRYMVDLFLDSAVRTQNSVRPYLAHVSDSSLPKSFRSLTKGLVDKKFDLPEKVVSLLLSYWKTNGERLRNYRDLAQHYSIVSTDARAYIDNEGKAWIYVALPNNPDVRRTLDLRFSDPIVHALPYLADELFGLLEFADNLVTLLLPEDLDTSRNLLFYHFTEPISPGVNLGIKPPLPDAIVSLWREKYSVSPKTPAGSNIPC